MQSLQLEKNVHIQTVQGHIAGVRALASSHSAPPSCLEEKGQRGHTVLFSGGARATLKAWLIDGVLCVCVIEHSWLFCRFCF